MMSDACFQAAFGARGLASAAYLKASQCFLKLPKIFRQMSLLTLPGEVGTALFEVNLHTYAHTSKGLYQFPSSYVEAPLI